MTAGPAVLAISFIFCFHHFCSISRYLKIPLCLNTFCSETPPPPPRPLQVSIHNRKYKVDGGYTLQTILSTRDDNFKNCARCPEDFWMEERCKRFLFWFAVYVCFWFLWNSSSINRCVLNKEIWTFLLIDSNWISLKRFFLKFDWKFIRMWRQQYLGTDYSNHWLCWRSHGTQYIMFHW